MNININVNTNKQDQDCSESQQIAPVDDDAIDVDRKKDELQSWVVQVHAALLTRGESLALAESCTGGLVSSAMTSQSGASRVFRGGVIAYANELKQNLLGVPLPLIEKLGAVSAPVALQMARGAREGMQSTWSIGITGIAGPDGGSEQKPVGTVFFGINGPEFEAYRSVLFENKGRQTIQRQAACFALQWLLELLQKEPAEAGTESP